MHGWSPERVAEAAGGRLVSPAPHTGGPGRVVIDSRAAGPGDLFVGLPGEQVDGGRFAVDALAGGAWGVLVAREHAEAARCAVPGALIAAEDPLAALGALALQWRRALGAQVVGVTGSTGKTSTKDLLAAMLAPHRSVVATHANLNTEIGLPLTILGAPEGTEVLVLEMAMRGAGQIAELVAIAEPDVGIITNVGPVHLELLGSMEAVAAAKAELVRDLRPGTTAVLPAGEPLLDVHLRDDITVVRFGLEPLPDGLELPFSSAHMLVNARAAVAAARALGVEPSGRVEVTLSAMRGQRIELPGHVVVVNDCYNANPMSMRAALDDLAVSADGRRVAVLGDMLELGPDERRFHAEIGEHARAAGVELLVTVGPLAREMHGDHAVDTAAEAAQLIGELVAPGDTVLVKASRGVGLEVVAEALQEAAA
ncbi:MAG: UDP-N-acetylmuramoyl-tripeptide--D-alanyl-D-alanine ligase [Solirubrobacteraceae bacterium]|nr:UDP-N-acetylmuramoyl-tripeptide--D-alanyl-D-alanine ligase [Solirubrobacteraceae bacterium]